MLVRIQESQNLIQLFLGGHDQNGHGLLVYKTLKSVQR